MVVSSRPPWGTHRDPASKPKDKQRRGCGSPRRVSHSVHEGRRDSSAPHALPHGLPSTPAAPDHPVLPALVLAPLLTPRAEVIGKEATAASLRAGDLRAVASL